MSVSVIGKGGIYFEVPFDSEFIESIVEKMKGMVSFNDVVTQSLQFEETVYFDMSGDNGIDYDQLDEIKEELLKEKDLRFAIYVNAYSECDGGYSFDSKEEKNDL